MVNDKQRIPPYSYGYAKATYDNLEQYEITTTIPRIKEDECLIVRLDGKGLTSRFKKNNELFLSDFHLAMKRVLENIKKYCSFVVFAYSFKDEISFLLNKDFIQNDKAYLNRIEKILSIISGYVSAMFSQYISKKLKNFQTESFAFDARIIILPKEKLKDYFHSRQAFAMAAFMDRICSFYNLSIEKRTVAYVKTALKENGMNWNNFPQYVCSGYVGFENEKWEVETASDFFQKWEKYSAIETYDYPIKKPEKK
ncbi:MAG: tRNA(His) guanylyltransferase Thg1 family protein [Clostridia bacterium]|nr:tRNA(His) guanylyltransferase Thg1 family protein [Clostridia bacterium]